MFYVEANPGNSPVGWVLKSAHETYQDAQDALDSYLADQIHDSDLDHWRISTDSEEESGLTVF